MQSDHDTNGTWLTTLRSCMDGEPIGPRAMMTRERTVCHTSWDSNYPILTIRERKLNYAFMYGEALWVLSGFSDVSTFARDCDSVRKYSDDGVHMSGAYGPEFVSQLRYVRDTLIGDWSTRRAVMTLWRKNPRESKDIPCTISLHFMVRAGHLHLVVYMRASDVWLGLPYDVFTFSMMIHYMIAYCADPAHEPPTLWKPGRVHIIAGSQHLYEHNVAAAEKLLGNHEEPGTAAMMAISDYVLYTPDAILSALWNWRTCPDAAPSVV